MIEDSPAPSQESKQRWSMRSIQATLAAGKRKLGRSLARHSAKSLMFASAAGLALCPGFDSTDAPQRIFIAETRAQVVETRALSSVAGSVPGREAVRKAQAAAVIEAQRMGLDISIASVGTGGMLGGDAAGDERAFARLVQRLPKTVKAAEEGDAVVERLSKSWKSGSKGLAEDGAPNASSQVSSDVVGRAGACVVELHATGESLRAMLTMAYDESAINLILTRARSLGITAADVAFLVGAHESAHCVIGIARRAGLFDTSWADPKSPVPSSWCEARCEDESDSPALAKAEESAADILAVFWAAETFGPRKARRLMRLAIYARALGAQSGSNDGLHDSSRALISISASEKSDRLFAVTSPARLAWTTAALETRGEIFGHATPPVGEAHARR